MGKLFRLFFLTTVLAATYVAWVFVSRVLVLASPAARR
jgi:hypothetical protein